MANKIVVVKTGPAGPRGPEGPSGPISSSAQFTSNDDVIFGTGSFSHISSNYITASLIDVDASTIRIGGTPLSKTDIDSLKEGKSIATGSKGGFTEFIEGSAFISSIDENVLIRTGNDRLSFNNGSGYILDLNRDRITLSGSVIISGSLFARGNSPAIYSEGDILLGYEDNEGANDIPGGIILNWALDSTASIYNYDDNTISYWASPFQFAKGGIISGSYSFTQGQNVTSTHYAHAQGYDTKALPPLNGLDQTTPSWGKYAHAEGQGTIAGTFYSHAEGINTKTTSSAASQGHGAHAEGKGTTAMGEGAHAEGINTTAIGSTSHAEGVSTVALGVGSHAEGNNTIASGSAQHVQGKYNTQGNITSLMIIGNGANDSNRSDLALFNTDGIEFTEPLSGSIISASGQLYAGIPEDIDPNNTSVVVINSSTGEFAYATSSFYYSSSVNLNEITFFQGDGGTEVLTVDTGSGGGGSDDDWTIDGTKLVTTRSVVIQSDLTPNIAYDRDFAHGMSTVASGSFSHAEGQGTLTTGRMSHAEGYLATASGDWAHAEGHTSRATARYSHTEGYNTSTNTNAIYSHAEGINSQTYGEGSHAAGKQTRAQGPWSHVAGSGSTAANTGSDVAGLGNFSDRDYQTVIGQYNGYNESSGMNKTDEAYFVIGAGTSNSARKNAMVVNTGSVFLNTALLPTSDPNVSGQLWRDGTDLKISLG